MSAVLAIAEPRHIKATHRRRRKATAGRFVQRYYDPGIGRFLSTDPVATNPSNGASFNRYNYANNNPYKFTDPDGRNGVTALGGVLYESAQFVQGNGFDSSSLGGALGDGYDGEGSGFAAAAVEDATTFIPVGVVAGALARTARVVSEAAPVVKVGAKITRSSLNRVKAMVKKLSTPAAKDAPIGQAKVDKLERIVEKAGGSLRNDGAAGVKGSSAGTPHVQTEGLGNATDSRHIWTEPDVKLKAP